MSNPLKVKELLDRTSARKAAGLIPAGPVSPGVRVTAKPPCRHLSEPTGEVRPCQGCGGKTYQVPVRACAVHGLCTVDKVVKLGDGTPVKCCGAMCNEYAAPVSTS